MSSLLELLSSDTKQVLTGSIQNRQANGRYRVDVEGKTITVRSLAGSVLSKGSKVIVVQVQGEYYITNKEMVKDRQPLRVAISG